MKSEKLKEDPDVFEMRVENVRHSFSLLAGRCYSRVAGKCEKRDPPDPCAIGNCPLLVEGK